MQIETLRAESASLAWRKTLRHGQRIIEDAWGRGIDREHFSLSSVQEFHALVLTELRGIPFRDQGDVVKRALTDAEFLKPTYSVGVIRAPEAMPQTTRRSQFPHVLLNGLE